MRSERDDCMQCRLGPGFGYIVGYKDLVGRCAAGAERRRQCERFQGHLADFLEGMGIYRRFIGASFEGLRAQGIPEQMRAAFDMVEDYASDLPKRKATGKGIFLKGPVGTGKTTLAVAVLRAALEAGYRVQMVRLSSLLDTLFTLRALNTEEWARYERRCREVDFLLLDDLGSEWTGSEAWVHTKVDSIISERYDRQLPTLLTSNLTRNELKGKYAERIIDRLRDASIVITLRGNSLRSGGGEIQ